MAGKGGSSREFPSWSDLKSALWWSIGAIVLGAFAAEGPIKLFELFIAGVKPVETAKPGTFDWLALVLWICFPLVAGFGFALCFVQATRAMKSRIASVYTDIAQHDEARHGKALVLALSSSSSSLTGASLPGLSGEAKVESFKNSDRHNHPWQQTIRAIDHHVRWNDSGIETFPYSKYPPAEPGALVESRSKRRFAALRGRNLFAA
ncbi:MAG: hypothetical protein H6851_12910 [Geminicoccaceae bacterium]|nr:hypothetical protein [Geminicoccaceae bacterium]